MTSTETVGVYIAINIALLVYLAFRVVSHRFSKKISIGDGGDEALGLAIRVHGNATEYIPGAMLGLFAAAVLGAPTLWLHLAGGAFTLGRLLHAFGLGSGFVQGRQLGMVLTWTSMIAIAGILLWLAFT